MDYGKLVAEKMRRYREENGMYQWQLGQELGVTQGTIGKYETERIMPPVDVIVRFARVLGVSIDELLSSNHPENGGNNGGDDEKQRKHQFLIAVWKAHQEIFKD